MISIPTWSKCISAVALVALAVGCASPKQTENLLTLAGFKPIAAHTAKQQQQLKALPPDQVSRIERKGKTYYVFPDVAHNRAWVGSPKEYRNYQQIRSDYQSSNQGLAAAKLGQDSPSDYNDWDGWEVVIWSD
ncbi:MAG: hypothetical protein WAO02_08645 [Verrucomicrobiia bacterium]